MSKHVFAGLVAVVAVAAAVVAGVVLTQQPAVEDWFDSNAAQGQFEGKSKEEIQAALNEEVAKGMMNISIAAVITFPDGTSEGEARIENIAANPMDQKVTRWCTSPAPSRPTSTYRISSCRRISIQGNIPQ